MLRITREDLTRYRAESLPYVRNAPALRARRVQSPTEILRPGGNLWARSGDWIVSDDKGGEADEWPVTPDAFAGSYFVRGGVGELEVRCVPMGWTSLCLMPTAFEVDAMQWRPGTKQWHPGPPHQGAAGDYLAIGPDGELWVMERRMVDDRLTLLDDPAPGKLKCFLSYNHKDAKKLDPFLVDLKHWIERDSRGGAIAFLDTAGIKAGDNWARTIAAQIAWTDFFLVAVGMYWRRWPASVARMFELPLAALAQEEHGCKIAAIYDQQWANDEELNQAAKSLTGSDVRLDMPHNTILDMDPPLEETRDGNARETARKLLDAWTPISDRMTVTKRRTEARVKALQELRMGPAPREVLTVGRGQGCWRLWFGIGGKPDVIGMKGRTLKSLKTDASVLEFDGDLPSAMVASDDRSVVMVQTADGLLRVEAGSRSRAPTRSSFVVRPKRPIKGLESLLAVRRDGRSVTLLYTGGGKTWECRVDGLGRSFGRLEQLDSVARIAAASAGWFVAYAHDTDCPVLEFVESALQQPGDVAPIALASCVDRGLPETRWLALLTECEGRRIVRALSGAGTTRTFTVDDDADSLDIAWCSGQVFVGVGGPSKVRVWSWSDIAPAAKA